MTKLPFKVGSEPRGRNIRIEMKVVSFFFDLIWLLKVNQKPKQNLEMNPEKNKKKVSFQKWESSPRFAAFLLVQERASTNDYLKGKNPLITYSPIVSLVSPHQLLSM